MRIIGGRYKGRRLQPPPGFRARPTTDFAREGLFNILNNLVDFESITVLDLFAGTGCISFEFESRGVPEIHLVEKDKLHISGIRKMIGQAGFTSIRPIHIDVTTYLKICKAKYDVVFADPPYDLPWLKELPDMVLKPGILNDQGLFILEHPSAYNFAAHESFSDHRNYGSVNFSFFKMK